MAVLRYDVPWRSDVDRVVHELLRTRPSTGGRIAQGHGPALNVWEDEEALFVEAELPGYTLEQLELSVLGNELSLRGSKRPEQSEVRYHRQERGNAGFHRVLTLPYDVDAQSVEARLKDGVLIVRLPKAASARPRKIPVVTQ